MATDDFFRARLEIMIDLRNRRPMSMDDRALIIAYIGQGNSAAAFQLDEDFQNQAEVSLPLESVSLNRVMTWLVGAVPQASFARTAPADIAVASRVIMSPFGAGHCSKQGT